MDESPTESIRRGSLLHRDSGDIAAHHSVCGFDHQRNAVAGGCILWNRNVDLKTPGNPGACPAKATGVGMPPTSTVGIALALQMPFAAGHVPLPSGPPSDILAHARISSTLRMTGSSCGWIVSSSASVHVSSGPWLATVSTFFQQLLARCSKTTEPHPLAFLPLVQDIEDLGKGPGPDFPNGLCHGFHRRMLAKPIQLLQVFELQQDPLEAATDRAERFVGDRRVLGFHDATAT